MSSGLLAPSPLLARASQILPEVDAFIVSHFAGVWQWDGRWTVTHYRTRFPAIYDPDASVWVAGDGTPWGTLLEAIEHLEWLAGDLGI